MLMLAGLMGLLMVGLAFDFTGGVKPDEGEAEGGGGSETQASEPSLDGNPLAEAIGGSDGGDILAGGEGADAIAGHGGGDRVGGYEGDGTLLGREGAGAVQGQAGGGQLGSGG